MTNTVPNQFFTQRHEVEQWLEEMDIQAYQINEDLSVNLNCNVHLFMHSIPLFPVQFGTINGDFYASNIGLESLKGMPKSITGNLYVNDNCLKSLEFSPQIIGKDYNISNNPLEKLDFQSTVKGNLICLNNSVDDFSHLAFQVNRAIQLSSTMNLRHLVDYTDLDGSIKVPFSIFKERQEIVNLKNHLQAHLFEHNKSNKKFKI